MCINKIIVLVLALVMSINPAFAAIVTVSELQDAPLVNNTNLSDPSKAFDKDHWAYKTLENVTKKYGLLVGKPEEKFDGTRPLSRNEAAILLISLVGKIEQNKDELNEAEKAQIDILRQELKGEMQSLTGRVENLESSVATLKGSVSRLEDADKKDWKFDFGEKFKINGAFQTRYTGITRKGADNYVPNFRIPLAEFTLSGKLYPHINYAVGLKTERTFTSPSQGLLGDAYVSTDILPHHNIYLGQSRVPIGYEGTLPATALDTIDKSQISRNFSETRDLGIKTVGSWNIVDYSVGVFNGNGQNTNDTNRDMNIATWAVIKPLYKYPRFGKLELGGGYNIGRKDTLEHQNVMSYYAGYKYKRYAIRGEYASANSYLANDVKARGWYVHNSYDITKKIQLIARFDQFDPNFRTDNNLVTESTLGTAYYLSGNNLKLQLNLVHVDDRAGKNSNRLGVQTQYKF